MTFSRRGLLKAGILIGIGVAAFFISWPLIVLVGWLNTLVAWPFPLVVAIIVLICALIVDEATEVDQP